MSDLMKRYAVTITGLSDLLMHANDINMRDKVGEWQKDPMNKKVSVKGDDRSPGWTWLTYCYIDNGKLCIPADNLMSVFREAGRKISSGNRTESMSKYAMSGIVVDEFAWPMLVHGNHVPIAPFLELQQQGNSSTYLDYKNMAVRHGFELFEKPATIGRAKHVRVRPRFSNWSASGTITVTETTMLTETMLNDIFRVGGLLCGIGDWRPNAPRSGPFGKFTATLKEIK